MVPKQNYTIVRTLKAWKSASLKRTTSYTHLMNHPHCHHFVVTPNDKTASIILSGFQAKQLHQFALHVSVPSCSSFSLLWRKPDILITLLLFTWCTALPSVTSWWFIYFVPWNCHNIYNYFLYGVTKYETKVDSRSVPKKLIGNRLKMDKRKHVLS